MNNKQIHQKLINQTIIVILEIKMIIQVIDVSKPQNVQYMESYQVILYKNVLNQNPMKNYYN
jgi:hypothetical protein